jgi:hypothetical protein
MVVRVLEDGTPDLGSPSSEIRFLFAHGNLNLNLKLEA